MPLSFHNSAHLKSRYLTIYFLVDYVCFNFRTNEILSTVLLMINVVNLDQNQY